MKDLQSHWLQRPTTFLQNDSPFLFRKDRPAPDPERSSPLNITCKIDLYYDFWNTKSFLLIHKAQQNVTILISTKFHGLLEKLLSQGPKRFSTSIGFVTPNVKQTIPHICLAMRQSKNRCWIVSASIQKQHLIHPFHCLFTKLSLVNTNPFLRYQRKILIFRGILAFHVQQLTGLPDFKTKSLYMFFTENFLLAVQIKESLWSLRCTIIILPTRPSHLSQLPPPPLRHIWRIYLAV
jgi:hypothetical protein